MEVQNLKDMVEELLEAFDTKNGRLPDKLIFFRDGVSEGELAAVQTKEIPQVGPDGGLPAQQVSICVHGFI